MTTPPKAKITGTITVIDPLHGGSSKTFPTYAPTVVARGGGNLKAGDATVASEGLGAGKVDTLTISEHVEMQWRARVKMVEAIKTAQRFAPVLPDLDQAVEPETLPPRNAKFILLIFLSKKDREAQFGDLEQEFCDVVEESG